MTRKERQLLKFMRERHAIYQRRKRGESKPWTKDKILRSYRFCNVYRELDTTTIWIHKHIREPFANSPHLWFMLCIARQINHPHTLSYLMTDPRAWPHDKWSPAAAANQMRDLAAHGLPMYGSAYLLVGGIQSLNPMPKDKPEFTCKHVLYPLWKDRHKLEPEMWTSMEHTVNTLNQYFGWGKFLAYEVACDLRYTGYLCNAPDIMTYANPGPGAKRGLNRIYGRETKQVLSDEVYISEMHRLLHDVIQPQWDTHPLEMREIEHSLCEFDKYERVRLGEGRPRQTYNGG